MSKTVPPLDAGKSARTSIIRPKRVIGVDKRGKMTTAAVVTHPSPVEKIASIHRNTQAQLKTIARQADPKSTHKRRT